MEACPANYCHRKKEYRLRLFILMSDFYKFCFQMNNSLISIIIFVFFTDSSSGYESTDISDVESLTSTESYDTFDRISDDSRNNFLPMDKEEEVMNFQSTHALCEHLKLILAMPEMCDVTFLVGPREVPVHGVRAIMGTRSRVMYQLILKHMSMREVDEERNHKKKKAKKTKYNQSVGIGRSLSQRLVIPVKKYDPDVFRMLVQFIHCGSVNITEETVAGLFCAASHFELSDLREACLDFVERCIKAGRAEKLLSSTRCYNQHKATKTLFDKIYSVLDKRYLAKTGETLV
ncbi:serine-enriched protein-like [Mercenaria mercenaria]|uniref:serine-enriched protein-like n=1 Tax=Mercenaria mercenaria TaxID=6596 RepID=UPI00234E6677|nr:serine-enriched protein-like [Mercenaria mercenaria]